MQKGLGQFFDIQQGIISIAMNRHPISTDDKGMHVEGKQDGAKNQTLRTTTGDREQSRPASSQSDISGRTETT